MTTYGENCYAVNVISSYRWPGSFTVSKSGRYYSIYIGDAIKRGDVLFSPSEPPAVLSDPSEKDDNA